MKIEFGVVSTWQLSHTILMETSALTPETSVRAEKKPSGQGDMYAKYQSACEAYIIQFKNDIQSKIGALEIVGKDSTEVERDKIRELMEYVYEYPKMILQKHAVLSATTKPAHAAPVAALEPDQICVAKRSDGEQCTRKKKKDSVFCGTHAKIAQMQLEKDTHAEPVVVHKMEISAEDVNGIIYYIDKYDNVYHTEDILENVENPRIIAKAIKHGMNSYRIPEGAFVSTPSTQG